MTPPKAKTAIASTPPKVPEFRLSIDLIDNRDLILPFATAAEALTEAREIIKAGYVIEDRTKDASNYEAFIHPLHQIRSLRVYEKK